MCAAGGGAAVAAIEIGAVALALNFGYEPALAILFTVPLCLASVSGGIWVSVRNRMATRKAVLAQLFIMTLGSALAALNLAITKLAEGKMVTASAYASAENFFFGHGETTMRVDGPPFDTATALKVGTEADTVQWYRGGDSTDPRRSVTARVGEGAVVAYGVEGTEEGMVNLVRALAVMGTQNFPQSDDTSTDRFNAMTSRNNERLSEAKASEDGSLAMIAVELGLAKATSGAVSERHDGHKAQLENMLQDIEEAPTEVVAMELLALKTRLEASYQATALLSQLSLVNYIK